MGKLIALVAALLAVFLAAALAGCVLEVTTGSIKFHQEQPPEQSGVDGEESPTE